MKALLCVCFVLCFLFLSACDDGESGDALVRLGQIGGGYPSEKLFDADLESFYPYPWRFSFAWSEQDRNRYKYLQIRIIIHNTGKNPITVWQKTGNSPGEQMSIVVESGTYESVYEGTVEELVGLAEHKIYPYISIWSSEEGRLRFNVHMELEGNELSEPIAVRLRRGEPVLW